MEYAVKQPNEFLESMSNIKGNMHQYQSADSPIKPTLRVDSRSMINHTKQRSIEVMLVIFKIL